MLKRSFDCVVAAIGLVVTSPLLLIAALLIKLTSRGPVFYLGVRVGQGGRLFRIFKLRTMSEGADTRGPAVTGADDARITPVGRVLRRIKLDELPQLLNVLRGEMSLVGPRPEHPEFVKDYSDEQRLVLSVRPGITSPGSLAFIDEEHLLEGGDPSAKYRRDVMPRKLALDIQYVRTASFAGDLNILARTITGVLGRQVSRTDR